MLTLILLPVNYCSFVPGSGPGDGTQWRDSTWQEYTPPAEVLKLFEVLGDKWLGMDVGEQDGRYIGKDKMCLKKRDIYFLPLY